MSLHTSANNLSVISWRVLRRLVTKKKNLPFLCQLRYVGYQCSYILNIPVFPIKTVPTQKHKHITGRYLDRSYFTLFLIDKSSFKRQAHNQFSLFVSWSRNNCLSFSYIEAFFCSKPMGSSEEIILCKEFY